MRSGPKAENVRSFPCVGTYVLVAHDRELIEVYERHANGGKMVETRPGELVRIECIDVPTPVVEVYGEPLGGTLARAAVRVPSISAA